MTIATRLPKGYLEMDRAGYADLDIETQRAVFAELREIVRYTMGEDHADSAIRCAYPVQTPDSPVEWIMSVFRVTCKCERCRGTGTYSWGACINGRMTHSGSCARCGGNGEMTFDDMRRGRAYDSYAIARAS
jgi:hypothetical protein